MKANILHIVYSLEIGGLERVVLDLTNNLPADEYTTYICCINKLGELSNDFLYQDRLINLGNRGRINFRSIKAIIDAVNKHSIDIIHSHNFAGLLYGYLAAKIKRIPIVHTEHGFIKKHDRSILNIIEKLMSNSVDEYVCVSRQLAQTIHKLFIADYSKISVIYNGISINPGNTFSRDPSRGEIRIGSVGRLNYIKNYELLIKSFSELSKRYHSIKLEIVGDGELYQDLSDQIVKYSLNDRISLPGFRMDVDQCLENMDIFVLPSFSEGHSISLLEAMSKSVVCIASNVGGNPEIIEDGINGYLFESNNLEGLTKAISYVIDNIDSEEMANIRKSSSDTVRTKFSVDAMLSNYIKLYNKFLQ